MINYNKITEIFCIVDEFCKEFDSETQEFILENKLKRPPRMSSSEIISIASFFRLSDFRCFKLHIIIKSEIISFCITQTNVDEREPLKKMKISLKKYLVNCLPIKVTLENNCLKLFLSMIFI